jgi:cytochrome c oxidase cbb3-type subunit 4
MDLNDLRTIVTAISFVVFVGIVYWAYNSRQRARFDEAANLPFIDGELPGEIPASRNVQPTEKSTGDRS